MNLNPYSLESEKAALGCFLLDHDTVNEGLHSINADDFYYPAHRFIYTAIVELEKKSQPIDILTLSELLKEHNHLEKVGGASYISSLIDSVPTTVNFKTYISKIKEKALRRGLIKLANEIVGKAGDGSVTIEEIINKVESDILNITQFTYKENFKLLKDLVTDMIEDIENRIKNDIKYTGFETGYNNLDNITTGFQPGDLIILAARPSMGKTTFALNLAANMSFDFDYNIAFFSLEMPASALVYKLVSKATKITYQDLQKGNIPYSKMQELIDKVSQIYEKNLIFEDSSTISIFDIKQKARRIKVKYGLDAIFIDYLQLIAPPKGIRAENRNVIISEISKGLKEIAKELNIPVIALSQLSRSVEKRDDKRPLLSDLRESGSIEQDADLVSFLYRDDYYQRKKNGEEDDSAPLGETELLIRKHRNGSLGKTFYQFTPQYSLFTEINKQGELD